MKKNVIPSEFTSNVETSLNRHIQLVESICNSFSLPFTNSISHQTIPLETGIGLACILDNYSMKQNISKQMGGDLTASLNLRLARAAEFSVFFLHSEGLEVATIIKGGRT